MKLFYSKGSCSLASHIVMAELNMVYELEVVDTRAKTFSGGDYKKINAKGAVPALQMESGEILTEGAVILQYLADQSPSTTLIPKFGTLDRYRCQEWLNYIGTDVHKSYSPLFFADRLVKSPDAVTELKNSTREGLKAKFEYISSKLGTNDFLMGSQFTVADAYLFTVFSWSKMVGVDLSPWANIVKYNERVASRPGVQKALREQGLL